MMVSWKWLQDYVTPGVDASEVVRRLTMSGLNHEETQPNGEDLAIDLEVTSNRPDCLGHIGIAREIAALFRVPLKLPDPQPPVRSGDAAASAISISVEAGDLCPHYSGRVLRGVRIGPSPAWMQERLKTAGLAPVNNVVDCTNYVMLECGQPLHAFDLKRLGGARIVVRRPVGTEKMTAIDHRQYDLEGDLCLIAGDSGPLAIGGVMGGAQSEVDDSTTDLLVEAAVFCQQAVRTAARRLNLHSPSSYRFERGVSLAGVDWASRRCCELILQTAGGTLCDGVVRSGKADWNPPVVTLPAGQVEAVLGIPIPLEECIGILGRLGLEPVSGGEAGAGSAGVAFRTPAWRADLTRGIDLIEEIGRIAGYERVPDDVVVSMVASTRTPGQRILGMVRQTLTAAGLDEAMTPSLVPAAWSESCLWWTSDGALRASQPMLGVLEKASQNIGAVEFARRSLVPSLLEARRINEYRGNTDADLFETAHLYLPDGSGLPREPMVLGIVSGRTFGVIQGLLRSLLERVCPGHPVSFRDCDQGDLDATESAELLLAGKNAGWMGRISPDCRSRFGLKTALMVAEVNLDSLVSPATLVRRQAPVSVFPAISRDFNFVVDQNVRWEKLESTVRAAAGRLAEAVTYLGTFRDPARDGEGRRRVLLQVVLRSHEGTLTGDQAEAVSQSIIARCATELSARLA